MKRSEMVLHLKETLEEIEVAQKSRRPNDKNFHKRHAEDILDMILGFGMLPPEYDKLELGHIDSNFVNEWEPE